MNLSPLQEGKPGVRWRADDTTGDGRAKRARLVLSPSTEQTTHKTETMDMTCPESCALLHTPLVSRLVKQPKEATTPHSILKSTNGRRPDDQISHAYQFSLSERHWLGDGWKYRQFSGQLFTGTNSTHT
ncbi:hypothetical protein J6590_069205 [Homalodisca vitripennis]|nr:hypothetical protein J6590_069205 [Homalodisca vitripennis]